MRHLILNCRSIFDLSFFTKFVIVSALAVSVSCTNADDDVFSENDGRSPRQLSAEETSNRAAAKVVPIAMASYEVKIYGERGMRLCIGALDLKLMSDLSFGDSSGGIRCLGKKIDMGSMLQEASGAAMNPGDIEATGQMIRANKLGNVEFYPARPLIVGPIVQDPSVFMGLDETSSHTAVFTDPVTGQKSQGTGSFQVKVLEVNGKYVSSRLGKTLDKILHWQITSTGFDGISKSEALAFERFEMYWNTRPLVVPKIVIVGAIESFISPGDSPLFVKSDTALQSEDSSDLDGVQKGGIISNILPSSVRIELEATRFEGL